MNLATLIEAFAIVWILLYIYSIELVMTYTMAAPLFFVPVLVFANQGGHISRLLMVRPLVLIGTLSFSIYMIHAFVTARVLNSFQLAANKLNVDIFTFVEVEGVLVRMVGKELWHGDLIYLLMLVVVVVASYFSYNWIEKPSRDWFRKIANKIWSTPSAEKRKTGDFSGLTDSSPHRL